MSRTKTAAEWYKSLSNKLTFNKNKKNNNDNECHAEDRKGVDVSIEMTVCWGALLVGFFLVSTDDHKLFLAMWSFTLLVIGLRMLWVLMYDKINNKLLFVPVLISGICALFNAVPVIVTIVQSLY